MTRLNPATITELRTALSDGYDVLHFICHGCPEGLMMEKESGRESFVYSGELIETLKEVPLKFVILNACESEEVAEKLHARADISAIVATKEKISDPEAFVLSERLYSALVAGKNLDEAIEWVRQGFREKTELDDDRVNIIKITGDRRTCFDFQPAGDYDTIITLNEPPNNLKYGLLDNFVGRGWEMVQELYPRFKDGARAVGITGIGGIGKSSLAIAAALKYSGLFPGGIIFASAKDIEDFGIYNIFSEMDNVLETNILEQRQENRESYALNILNSNPHLLILDNLDFNSAVKTFKQNI